MADGSCCIVGGGPAGMMLGFLLARAGVSVTVLEKHPDFLRDFRGDTIHPSTLEVIAELGLLDAFLARPHNEVRQLVAEFYGNSVPIADFSHVPTRCKFLAFMPQWDFLDFIAEHARRLPNFSLRMEHEVVGVRRSGAQVIGVTARTPQGEADFEADLVVAADGRHSVARRAAGLELMDYGAPIDVLWFRLPRDANDRDQTGGYVWPGLFFVMIDRGDYWQCAYVIRKGQGDAVRARLPALRARLAAHVPFLEDNLRSLRDPEQLKLLEVQVNRLRRWYAPGLLCIGDAAHAMSPVGGVGVNLAIQDAVAAARLLAAPLRERRLGQFALRAVQRRRELPARLTQWVQLEIQQHVIREAVEDEGEQSPSPKKRLPLPLRLLLRYPRLRRVPARLVGIGIRPEHIAP
jgi:2-polyprenyl-6-methoxyphenol hydroxylase-like FAD-dependent oxidoreductase